MIAMNKAKIRWAKRQIYLLEKKKKESEKIIKKNDSAVKRITKHLNDLEGFKDRSEGAKIRKLRIKKGATLSPDWTTGIWIVKSREGRITEMVKFFDFIKETEPLPKMSLELPTNLVGEDGKEVTFNEGDLISCTYLGDLKEGGTGFHFANVGPSGENSQLQYEYALGKLGLGIKVQPGSFLVVDGVFRKKVS